MIPIAKNISVVDEQGNEYEATYPKRAEGLVKKGRARFISGNKICLACPPDGILEDNHMTNTMDKPVALEGNGSVGTAGFGQAKADDIVTYLLKQIESIINQTQYINEVIDKLSKMHDGDSGVMGAPGNTLGQAKACALGDVVRSREATNQQILELYKMIYTDLRQKA